MRPGVVDENAVLWGDDAEFAQQPVLPQAPTRFRVSPVSRLGAVRSVCRAAWSFWLDESCNVPDPERYCSTSPSISNFSTRK